MNAKMKFDANITWHEHRVSREARERVSGNKGCVIWISGLSGSGKSTIANTLDHKLHHMGMRSFVLDGDNVRHKLNAGYDVLKSTHSEEFSERFGLGFSSIDREENIRRVGAVAQLFCEAGIIAIAAFISPYRSDRRLVRGILAPGEFFEVYLNTPIQVCEARDPKGLYKKARRGEIEGFTGVDDPYEPPESAELTLSSAKRTPDDLANEIIAHLVQQKIIPPFLRKVNSG